jgi:hypothetical protein
VKNKTLVGLSILLFSACTGTAISQESKVPLEVWAKAKAGELVKIIVQLNVRWQPEGKLSPQERVAQREAIAAAQHDLIAELSSTNHKVSGQLRFIPTIGLEVGPDALVVLERSPRVSQITEDVPYDLLKSPR